MSARTKSRSSAPANGKPTEAPAPAPGRIVVEVVYDAEGEIAGVGIAERKGVNAFAAPTALRIAASVVESQVGAQAAPAVGENGG